MENKVNVLGVYVDKVTVSQAADRILSYIDADGPHCVFTPNSEMIMSAYRDPALREVLNSADLCTPDGIGVVYASKLLQSPMPERAAGYDIACALLPKLSKRHLSLYLFGAKPGVAQAAANAINAQYPGIHICGAADGYFDEAKEQAIIADIAKKQPDVVFVCLGVPKQEFWIHKNKARLNARVLMGLGGCLDVFAGTVKRAPEIYQKLGIEWLYRLAKEPKRIGRMMDLPKFAATVLIKGRKFPQD